MLILRRSLPRNQSHRRRNTPKRTLDLVVKGNWRSAKEFPVIDLFREIHVEFARSPQSTLHNMRRRRSSPTAARTAAVHDNFLLASELGELILKTAKTRPPLS